MNNKKTNGLYQNLNINYKRQRFYIVSFEDIDVSVFVNI